jgi:hypothetical protein
MTATPIAESTPVLPGVATMPSPVEYVRRLDADQKHAVFMELLREAVELNGELGLLPIEDVNGESFGYFVPPKAAAELARRTLPPQTEADIERTRQALANLDDTYSLDELLTELNRADVR